MKLPSIRGNKVPPGHLPLPNEASGTEVTSNPVIRQIGPIGTPNKLCDGFPQSDSKATLLKAITTQVIEHGETELMSHWRLHPYRPMFRVLKGTLHTTEEEK